ncbi:hypothetical protein [Oryzihumus leptocrescens]|uniref:Uncharacterized protein n=1 Tax=Oryzihumus leptocrescens TaxID=297536 RepID=A0A542Z9G7_9MICO|nr:hypothetical protein [Oryzihumus leptocrescens]TQL56998.1 hypothetical protein FB474_3766 [Oryzihumus leptocrescens]
MSRKAKGGAGAGPGKGARKVGAAPPREAVTIALLLVVPAELLLLDGNLSVPQLVARVAGALALTWLAASVIGGTVRSARRSLARARAEAAAEEARARREARKAAKAAAAEAEQPGTGQSGAEQSGAGQPGGGPLGGPFGAEVSGAAYGLQGE